MDLFRFLTPLRWNNSYEKMLKADAYLLMFIVFFYKIISLKKK